jgi:hypothetical protein
MHTHSRRLALDKCANEREPDMHSDLFIHGLDVGARHFGNHFSRLLAVAGPECATRVAYGLRRGANANERPAWRRDFKSVITQHTTCEESEGGGKQMRGRRC